MPKQKAPQADTWDVEVISRASMPAKREQYAYRGIADQLQMVDATEACRIRLPEGLERRQIESIRQGVAAACVKRGCPVTTRIKDGYLYVARKEAQPNGASRNRRIK